MTSLPPSVTDERNHPLTPQNSGTRSPSGRLLELAWSILKLGLISFGGPVAHLSYLREEFVSKRRWLDDVAYGDLVALCQFLPGPASSQVVFTLGMQRAGWLGGVLASLCFTLPSAVLMIAFAYGVAALGGLQHAGWLHGLKLAAVAVVAQAVWGSLACPARAGVRLAWTRRANTCAQSIAGRGGDAGNLRPRVRFRTDDGHAGGNCRTGLSVLSA